MNFKKLALLFIIYFSLIHIKAQTNWCISGRIIDIETGDGLVDAQIVQLDAGVGAVSTKQGEFNLCGLTGESVGIVIKHISYEPLNITVTKSHFDAIVIRLIPRSIQTQEVVVSAKSSSLVKSFVPGKLTIRSNDILTTPSFLGSPDVVKTLQLLPGIQSVSEGNSGIYVRGGSPGQNYILFDGIELMNPSHIMGIYSVFNPLLTDKVEFFKGNAPIQYSSRLASCILVTTRNDVDNENHWSGNIGNMDANLTYSGASKNNKWFYSTGFRRSYIELLKFASEPFIHDDKSYFEENNYHFHDFNGKIRYQDHKNQIAFSWYQGADVFKFAKKLKSISALSKWGNRGAAISWQRNLSSRLNMSNGFDVSSYRSNFNIGFNDEMLDFSSAYKHYRLRSDFTYEAQKHLIRSGISGTRYQISPQDIDVSLFSNTKSSHDLYNSLSGNVYLSDQITLNDKWILYGGINLNSYALLGPYLENSGSKINYFSAGEIVSNNLHINSVINISYFTSPGASIKGSYSYLSQNLHLAPVASIPLPSDIWMTSTPNLPAELGHQLTVGYFEQLDTKGLEVGVELYGKSFKNQLLLNVNVNNEERNSFEDNFFKGNGIAYGAELIVKLKRGNIESSMGYTIGSTRVRFPEINDGKWYDATYDRRHDLNIVCSYKLNSRINISSVFIFATGNKATLPTGRYWLMGNISNDYDGVNNFRMPSYHRLDAALNYSLHSKTFNESILSFAIINLYNRSNPYFIYYQFDKGNENYELSIKAKQVSLFPILPSISWRFKF